MEADGLAAPPSAEPATPAKQDRGLELLPIRVSSPTLASPGKFPGCAEASPTTASAEYSPSTSTASTSIADSPAQSQEPMKVQIVLQLASALEEPKLGSGEMPTVGSRGHKTRSCKPCAFLHTRGCDNGVDCPFCHLCLPGEKKRRLKEKKDIRMQATQYLALQEQIRQEYEMYIPPPR